MQPIHGDDVSDEPTRLERLVSTIFRPQAGTPAVQAAPNSSVQLVAGVVEQDDCAVYAFSGDQELVVGSDYVRGPKFRLYQYGLLSNYDLGYYLAVANLSDVAAMGAKPIGLLTVIRYPPDMTDGQFAAVLEGVRDACTQFATPTVGGDIGGAERLILSATALGVCRKGGSLRRRGARPGDILCLTGPTGVAGAAMQYYRYGKRPEAIETGYGEQLLQSWKRPIARVREGTSLGACGWVTAAQDTSDGLKATIGSIAAASDVGFVVDEAQLPVSPAVVAVSKYLDLDVTATIMSDSVDFQLLFTVPERHLPALRDVFDQQSLEFTPIGRATAARSVLLRTATGQLEPLPGEGWRHVPERAAGMTTSDQVIVP